MSSTDVAGVPNPAAPIADPDGRITQSWRQFLVALWQRTGGGSGGGVFNQNTDYALSVSQASRSTAARFLDFVTFTDYGAIGDGVGDCTAALNAFIADVNAGLVRKMYVPPGTYLIQGDTTPITQAYAIFGAGNGISEIRISGGASILLDATIVAVGRQVCCSWADIKFSGADAPPYVRQLARFSMSTSLLGQQVQLQMVNVQVDPGFKYGIETVNLLFGSFVNVSINSGGRNAGMQWGWYSHATVGNYSLGLQWWNCSVSALDLGWKGDGHLEGFVWTDCLREFVNRGINCAPTDTTFAPYFHVHGGQGEAYIKDLYFSNCSYVKISDSESYLDANAVGIHIDSCYEFKVHHASIVNIGAGNGNMIKVTNSQVGSLDHNALNGLNGGVGISLDATTSGVTTDNTTYIYPAAGSIPYFNAQLAPLNKRRNDFIVGTFADSGLSIGSGTGATVTTAPQIMAQMPLPCYAGDRIQLQATFQITSPSGTDTSIACRIREYNHRPGSPIPFQVIQTNATQNYLEDLRKLPPTGFQTIIVQFDAEVQVIGTATDALFVCEAFTDIGSAIVQLVAGRAFRL